MKSTQNIKEEEVMRKSGTRRLNIYKLGKRLFSLRKQVQSRDLPLSLYLLRYEKLSEHARKDLTTHEKLMLKLGFRVKEIELTEKIPDEYIGIHYHLSEGRLVYQEYLKIQAECVEKKRVVYQRQDLSDDLMCENSLRNIVNSYY